MVGGLVVGLLGAGPDAGVRVGAGDDDDDDAATVLPVPPVAGL